MGHRRQAVGVWPPVPNHLDFLPNSESQAVFHQSECEQVNQVRRERTREERRGDALRDISHECPAGSAAVRRAAWQLRGGGRNRRSVSTLSGKAARATDLVLIPDSGSQRFGFIKVGNKIMRDVLN